MWLYGGEELVDVVLKYSRAVRAITSDSRRLVSATVSRYSEFFPASMFLFTIHPSASQFSFYSTDLTFAMFSIHIPYTSLTSAHIHGRHLRSFRNFVGERGINRHVSCYRSTDVFGVVGTVRLALMALVCHIVRYSGLDELR